MSAANEALAVVACKNGKRHMLHADLNDGFCTKIDGICIKMMHVLLKMMDFVLKMMNFALGKSHMLQTFELRPPVTTPDNLTNTAFKVSFM